MNVLNIIVLLNCAPIAILAIMNYLHFNKRVSQAKCEIEKERMRGLADVLMIPADIFVVANLLIFKEVLIAQIFFAVINITVGCKIKQIYNQVKYTAVHLVRA